MLLRRFAQALTGLACLLPAVAHAAGMPVVIPGPIAPPVKTDGDGLCIASIVSQDPVNNFNLGNAAGYPGAVNAFFEANKKDRVETVLRTILDLSNNNMSGEKQSYGDFTNAMAPLCKIGGCDFFINDATTSFGSRLRGFLNVTADLANKPMHIGIYTDDAASLTFFGKSGSIYPIMVEPGAFGFPTWRLTETVTFQQEGLYPLEVLFVEIGDHAALEMAYFFGDFVDFQRSTKQPPFISLKDAGFTLFPQTFFTQTVSGQPSYPDVNKCKQCDRQFVNLPGNNGCDPGYYCNEAALCAPCDSALLCGPTCSPCGGDTPFCINSNGKLECGQCRNDFDCKDGFSCDVVKHVCQECNVDADCPRGKECDNHVCRWCPESDKCAGSSCNCCPKTAGAQAMKCAPLDKDGPPVCVECTDNTECASGVCDILVGLCVPELAKNEKPDCCGDTCEKCPEDLPFCLPGHFGTACAECRNDLDCKDGEYCLSGACQSCTRDRECGIRCETCSGSKPFCTGQVTESAACVRCTTDSQCGGGTCDQKTHDCVPACTQSCTPDKPYCFGTQCVQCYADTQCPCGGTCDFSTHTCSSSCKNNGDCLGAEHCRYTDDGEAKECAPGPMVDDVGCGGTLASACDHTIAPHGDDPLPVGGIVGLTALGLLGRRRKRSRA
ncbi:MAG: outer membrane exchange protein TraA family protein [Byssovorax sp.]